MRGAILTLVVNDLRPLSTVVLQSILRESDCQVIVGYIYEEDLDQVPKSNRITTMKLCSNEVPSLSGEYQPFSSDLFFKIVELKWELFERAIALQTFSWFVYSDLDVIWLKDCAEVLEEIFQKQSDTLIVVQDARIDPAIPLLCMGIFAFRVSEETKSIVASARLIHEEGNRKGSRFGDDDAISSLYSTSDRRHVFYLLPQQSFPIGRLGSLWMPFNLLRGLKPEVPFIFHANYIEGIHKKSAVIWYFERLARNQKLALFLWVMLRLKLLFLKAIRRL